jgi:SAM-dependent methyltransferase
MSQTSRTVTPTAPNAEAIEAWDGPLFDRFVQYRHIVTTGLGAHGDAALALHPPPPGGHVLDIGCGFGDTTRQIAALVGPDGEVVGVDAAPRFVEAATHEAQEAGVSNVRYAVADVQTADLGGLGGPFSMAFSRMGTMFFANPVVALRHVREALAPGAPLVMVVWRRREDNGWLYVAQQVVERLLGRPEEYTEPTCGPGPFSMAGADTVSDVLLHAGFEHIGLQRSDLPLLGGRDLDEAVELVMAIGPAGEMVRLWGDRMAHRHDEVRAAVREALSAFVGDDGAVHAPASTWIVSARAPAAGRPAP